MRATSICLVVGLATALPAAGQDDGLVTWGKGYPKAGPKPGQVLVQGSAKPQTGYTLVSATAEIWPKCGGEVTKVKVTLNNDGTFGPTTISGLESGSSYNLIVMATESRDGQEQRRITQ